MVTLGDGTGHTFVTRDQHAVCPFSLAVLLALSSCRPPCAHLMLSSYCPPHAVLILPSSRHCAVLSCCYCLALSCHPPCAILPSSSCRPPHATICLVPFPHVATPWCLHHTVPNTVHLVTTRPSKQLASIQMRCALGLPTPLSCPTNGRPTFASYLVFPISFFPHSSLISNMQPMGTRHHGLCRSPPDDPSSSITHRCPLAEFSVLSLHAVTWSV